MTRALIDPTCVSLARAVGTHEGVSSHYESHDCRACGTTHLRPRPGVELTLALGVRPVPTSCRCRCEGSR